MDPHASSPAPPSTRVEHRVRSHRLPPKQITPDLLHQRKVKLFPPLTPLCFVVFCVFLRRRRRAAQSAPLPALHRAKTHSRCPERRSALRVRASLLPADLSPRLPFHSALSRVESGRCEKNGGKHTVPTTIKCPKKRRRNE